MTTTWFNTFMNAVNTILCSVIAQIIVKILWERLKRKDD